MYERLSRFNTKPGDIKVPPGWAYPSKPVNLEARWLVRMIVDGVAWLAEYGEPWPIEMHVWATTSTEAVAKAQAEFCGNLAALADRKLLTLRVTEVLQVSI